MPSILGEYVSKLYSEWKTNRQELELKWEENWNAFKRISSGKWKKSQGEKPWQSDTFVDLTSQKVSAGMSLVLDILLKGGKVPFMLKGDSQESPGLKGMQKLIEDQLAKSKSDRVLASAVFSAALYGEAPGKFVINTYVDRVFLRREDGAWGKEQREYSGPGTENISVWDFFTDLENSDIYKNSGVIQRQRMSRADLRALLDTEDEYLLGDSIKKVIKGNVLEQNNLSDSDIPPAQRLISNKKKGIEVLEFWGRVPLETVERFEEDILSEEEKTERTEDGSGREVEVMVMVAGGEVIRYARNNLGTRPFVRVFWDSIIDDIGGSGVADNLKVMQKSLNGVVQTFEDNKKLASNGMIAVKKRFIMGDFTDLKPGKIIHLREECGDVNQAIQPFKFPDVGDSLLGAINLFERWANNSSMIPEISQGMAPSNQATAYEVSVRTEKSGKYIASVIRNFDDMWIEPFVERFYEYNMLDPEVAPDVKDNYAVQSLGFTSFQDNFERVNNLMQFLQMALNSQELGAEMNIRWLCEEIAKAKDLDPAQVLRSEEEKQQRLAVQQEQQQIQMQQQSQAFVLELEKRQAEIEKLRADAESKIKSTENERAALIDSIESQEA